MKNSGMALLAVIAGGALALAGAASANDENSGDPRVGEEVSRICFGRDINNFETIEGEDDAVLLEKSVNEWYKVTLIGACSYRQLKWAMAVAFDDRTGCVTRGDALIFTQSVMGDFSFQDTTRCIVDDIYRWDPKANAESAADADLLQEE